MNIAENRFKVTSEDNSPCVYIIYNIDNEKVYVGESKTPIKRWSQHRYKLSNGIHENKEMQKDFDNGNNFVFSRFFDYTEDRDESLRYYELATMDIWKDNGSKLYNKEANGNIKNLLKFSTKSWELHCLMERKRDEYYKKYFGCTYHQLRKFDQLSRKKNGNYMQWKIKWFNKERKIAMEKEKRLERKNLLKTHEKVSLYIKKDVYKKLKEITYYPEKYISKLVEKAVMEET